MKASRTAALAHVKRQAATMLESVAAEHETLRQQCQVLSTTYQDLEVRYLALERAHANCAVLERVLHRTIARLEQPFYVRWFGLGEDA